MLNQSRTTNGPPSWLTSPSGFNSLVPSSKKPSSFSNGVIAPIAGFVFFIVLGLPLRWLRLKEYYLFKLTHLGTGRPESTIQVHWLPNQSPLCSSSLARYCSSNLLIRWGKEWRMLWSNVQYWLKSTSKCCPDSPSSISLLSTPSSLSWVFQLHEESDEALACDKACT